MSTNHIYFRIFTEEPIFEETSETPVYFSPKETGSQETVIQPDYTSYLLESSSPSPSVTQAPSPRNPYLYASSPRTDLTPIGCKLFSQPFLLASLIVWGPITLLMLMNAFLVTEVD